jgi:hypothetical protein
MGSRGGSFARDHGFGRRLRQDRPTSNDQDVHALAYIFFPVEAEKIRSLPPGRGVRVYGQPSGASSVKSIGAA